jgi:cobalt-zinc-cadmium efflux system outer membrane protein
MSCISFERTRTCAVMFLLSALLLPRSTMALTLEQAEARALAHNPTLAAHHAVSMAADAEAEQAARWNNPEISYSRENIGNSALNGLDGPTSRWQLSQELELFGARNAKREGARAEAEVVRIRTGRERQWLLADVRTAWVEVLVAQQRAAMADALRLVLGRTQETVTLQVKAGKVSPVELTRVEVAVAALERRAQQAKQTLVSARQRLAQAQGLSAPDFGELSSDSPTIKPLPPLESLIQAIAQSPTLKEAEAQSRAREASVREMRAARLSNPSISVGHTIFEEAGESAWQVGIGVSLPLFNRNKDGIRAAEARLQESHALQKLAEQKLRGELEVLYPEVKGLEQQLTAFEKTVLPASDNVFDAVNKGYRYGKFGLLDVLDAQRTLIETRFEYFDTLTEYHRQRNRLDALTAPAQEELL